MTTPAPDPDHTGLPRGYPFKPDWEVAPRDLKRMLDRRSDVFLLDCRTDEEWRAARIDAAVHIPMDQIPVRTDELEQDAGGRDALIAVICHHGMRSLKVAAILRSRGFNRAYSLAGGIDAWSTTIDPTIPRY